MPQFFLRNGHWMTMEQIKRYNSKNKKQVEQEVEGDNSLADQYFKKFNRDVPNRYKNDVEWIKSKLT